VAARSSRGSWRRIALDDVAQNRLVRLEGGRLQILPGDAVGVVVSAQPHLGEEPLHQHIPVPVKLKDELGPAFVLIIHITSVGESFSA
jgi:hypothetical protein